VTFGPRVEERLRVAEVGLDEWIEEQLAYESVDDQSLRWRLQNFETLDLSATELADWSADGRTIYFKSHDARGHASFWSLPATRGRPRLRVRFEAPGRQSTRIVWSTDGTRFYFTIEDRQSDVWIAELTPR